MGRDDRFRVVEQRLDVLQALRDGPLSKRDLIDRLDVSRSTVDRAVDDLLAADLARRTDGGFRATLPGRMALERYRSYRHESEALLEAGDLIARLPPDADVAVELVAGAEVRRTDDAAPYRPLEDLHDAVADADRYRALLPTLADPRHVRLLYEHVVVEDRPADLVVAPDLSATLREEFDRRLEAMLAADRFDVRVGDVPPFGLVLTTTDGETTASVVVHDDDGVVRGVLRNDDADAVDWAAARFDTVRADATADPPRLHGDGGTPVETSGSAGRLPPALAASGFVRPSPEYFAERRADDLVTALLAGLGLPEVHAGYAVDRTRPADHGRRSVADELLAALREGESVALLGPPGSGKSTVCKQAACRWYRDDGAVIYRAGGHGGSFDSRDALVDAATTAPDPTLVVVEDAVRPDAREVFDAAATLDDRDDVAVLVDARRNEWTDPPGSRLRPELEAVRTDRFETVSMPSLSARDRDALLEQLEGSVGEPVAAPDRTSEDANRGPDPDDLLYVLHHAAAAVDPIRDDAPTTLEADARSVLETLLDAGDAALDVGVLVNLLNAAGFEVTSGLVGALAARHDPDAIRDSLDRLEGRVLFERRGGDPGYRTVHESWSAAFLAELREVSCEETGSERFGRCGTALLALAEDSDRRRRARAVAADEHPALDEIGEAPEEWADDAVERLFTLGERYPKLAPLYGEPGSPPPALPDACSPTVALRRLYWHAYMTTLRSDYDVAERACELLRRRTENPTANADPEHAELHVLALLELADIAEERQDGSRSRDRLVEEALDAADALDDDRLTARALWLDGRRVRRSGDPDAAVDRFEEALELARAAGDRLAEVDALLELGYTATIRHDHQRAIEYKREGLELAKELGAREKENRAAGDLGMDYFQEGDVEEAVRWWQRSLDIARDIGDRYARASNVQNLGMVQLRRGRYDAAEERFEAAIDLKREIETDATAPKLNLAKVQLRRGEHEAAIAQAREAIDECEADDWTRGALAGRTTIASVDVKHGDLDSAARQAHRNIATSREIDDVGYEITNWKLLGEVARERREFDAAERMLARSRRLAEDIGADYAVSQAVFELGRLSRVRGDRTAARNRLGAAVQQFRDAGAARDTLDALEELVAVLAANGEAETAAERCDQAVKLAADAGFDDAVSRFREHRQDLDDGAT